MTQNSGFTCDNCRKWVPIDEYIGTKNRNHCPFCLWSKHVDQIEAGDRAASCHGGMKPVALTLKQAGKDKYGKDRPGELMLVHICSKCGKISINRIAADDDTQLIQNLNDTNELTDEIKQKLVASNIQILDHTHRNQVDVLLFGKH